MELAGVGQLPCQVNSDFSLCNSTSITRVGNPGVRVARQRSLAPAFVLTRGRHFGPHKASSVDLCTETLVGGSQFRTEACVLGPSLAAPFTTVPFLGFSNPKWHSCDSRARLAVAEAMKLNCNVIIMQEHLPTAAAMASLWGGPVVLHTHNFVKTDFAKGFFGSGSPRRNRRKTRFAKLAGLIHVSEACSRHFNRGWPDLEITQAVIPNALRFEEWNPKTEREKCVLCVGRSVDYKGILEAAEGIVAALTHHTDWTARFILSEVSRHPDYFKSVAKVLEPLGRRATITTQAQFAEVKSACESAAIAIVPSKWDEPFGRTALEAHAGGASLISSGTGGLREVSERHAFYLEDVQPATIARAIDDLIKTPEKRAEMALLAHNYARKRFDVTIVCRLLEHWLEDVMRRHVDESAGKSRA